MGFRESKGCFRENTGGFRESFLRFLCFWAFLGGWSWDLDGGFGNVSHFFEVFARIWCAEGEKVGLDRGGLDSV